MGNKLYVIGMGPGSSELVHPMAQSIIESSHVLMGGRRNLEAFDHRGKETVAIGNNLDEIYNYIAENIGSKRIAVLATGDPGIYSIMSSLKENLPQLDMEVVPGISSLQYLCSKLQLSWNDMSITSVHGRRQQQLLEIIRNSAKTAVFTGGEYSPGYICKKLMECGISNVLVSVGENLSYDNERIVTGSAEELRDMSFGSLALMIIQRTGREELPQKEWRYSTPGIPDDLFIRGNVPMTKEEIRAAAISKLRLQKDSLVFDIGAGTGSVSVECGLACSEGTVYAIEMDSDGIELIKQNTGKFDLHNVNIITGKAPLALSGLPQPDRVFIGGSGGNMGEILDWITTQCTHVRVVINTVTIESTYEAMEGLKNRGFGSIEAVNLCVSRSREAGGKHLMIAANPVYIISAEKGE